MNSLIQEKQENKKRSLLYSTKKQMHSFLGSFFLASALTANSPSELFSNSENTQQSVAHSVAESLTTPPSIEIPSETSAPQEPIAQKAEATSQEPIATEPVTLFQDLITAEPTEQEPVSPPAEAPSFSSPKQTANSSEKDLTSHLQVGANYTRVNFRTEGISSFEGNLGGLQGLYEYKAPNRIYAAASLAWREGSFSGSTGTRDLLYIDAHERVGYTLYFPTVDVSLSLFTGAGYRYYGEDFKPKISSALHFFYNEFYIPVGLSSLYTINSLFSLGMNFSWMPQVFSNVEFGHLQGANWKLTNTLNNLSVEIPLNVLFHRFSFSLAPFYEYWEDGHSTAKTSTGVALGLPGNIYNFWGINLNVSYAF